MKIYLVGYMGSGKSKTAVSLAKQFRYDVFDTDTEIEKKAGKEITRIFAEDGEDFFRRLEKEVLQSTVGLKNTVISTGGGTPSFFDNMEWMNENGFTVYLEANAGLLFHRLVQSREGRPLIEKLSDVDLMEQISGHLAVRIPFYRRAKLSIPAASVNVNKLYEQIKAEAKR